jgi:cytochrome c oxidase subunit I
MHGLIMVFGAIMPAFVGFANWQIPMMIGAPDMAFARMNNWSFWLLPPAAILLVVSFFVPGGRTAAGWTLYRRSPPDGHGHGPRDLRVHIMGASSIMGSINIITTILNMRAPGMTLMKMPLFVWTWLITAYLLIAVMPVLAGAITMMLTDRHFGTNFFNAAGGGDPVLFQHIFWFFGHPEVYIMILPAFGIVSQIIPAFSRKPLFGYASMVYATASIAILSFIVWAHHMFTVGMPAAAQLFFMYATMLIAVPTGREGVQLDRDHVEGLDDLRDADAVRHRFHLRVHDGRLHRPRAGDHADRHPAARHLLRGGALPLRAGGRVAVRDLRRRLLLAAEVDRHMYDETLGKWHFWLSMIFFNITFFPQHFLGLAGMPRRIPDYALQFADFNMISTDRRVRLRPVAAAVPVHRGEVHPRRREGGGQAVGRRRGLEWTVPSPAPYHTFETPPVVK